MKVIAAYLLACLGGNAQPSSSDVQSILNSVGIDIDEKRLQLFMSQVDGKDISEVIASGRQKLASVPSGGGACVAVAAGNAAATTGGAAPAAESKPAKVEEKEESDDDMGFSLFD